MKNIDNINKKIENNKIYNNNLTIKNQNENFILKSELELKIETDLNMDLNLNLNLNLNKKLLSNNFSKNNSLIEKEKNIANLNAIENLSPINLKFEVESWSSYNFNFHPNNICIDNKISGNLSKWSVDFKSRNEFIFLKLEKTSIISVITFGKFRDPTNLKEFKIFAGLDKNNLFEILHSGLTYDGEYEPFSVKQDYQGILMPCK